MALIYFHTRIGMTLFPRASDMIQQVEDQIVEDGRGIIKGPAVEEWGEAAREARGTYMPEPVPIPVWDDFEPTRSEKVAGIIILVVIFASLLVISWLM